jgi:hypothetical protein
VQQSRLELLANKPCEHCVVTKEWQRQKEKYRLQQDDLELELRQRIEQFEKRSGIFGTQLYQQLHTENKALK